MLSRFFKTISGGNSRYEWKLLEEARSGTLTRSNIDHLLGMKADINTVTLKDPGLEGYTPLMHFVGSLRASPEVVNHLLDCGADPRARSKYGHTALAMVWYGNREPMIRKQIVELLISRGVDPNSADSSGYTPLHNACRSASPDEINLLLSLGARKSVNKCGKRLDGNPYWGFAPLHTAIFETRRADIARLSIVQSLVEHGADVNLRCNSTRKYTPIELIDDGLMEASTAHKREDTDHRQGKWRDDLADIKTFLLANGAK